MTTESFTGDSAMRAGDFLQETPLHAFHRNLPKHHASTSDHVPYISKFSHNKARAIVQLCHSIQLSTELFQETSGESDEAMDITTDHNESDSNDDMIDEDDYDEAEIIMEEDEDPHHLPSKDEPDTLNIVIKKCLRLSSQVSAWEAFKYGGISQKEQAQMILHLIRLVTAAIVRNHDGTVQILYEQTVGYLIQHHLESEKAMDQKHDPFSRAPTLEELKDNMRHPFALPSPAREALLSVLCNILSNKGPLRSASNAALFIPGAGNGPRFTLVLHWQIMLRLLLRTAPYLDAHEAEASPRDSASRVSICQKRTVQFVRDSRRFFLASPSTALGIWGMVRNDVLFHSHTHACYRGTILLYLLLPSRCSPHFFQQVLPEWFDAWTNIDRCPEYDFLWLALFCRARKYLAASDDSVADQGSGGTISTTGVDWRTTWRWIRQRLLTMCQYWCLLPIGGTTTDKWTQAPHPRPRACPAKLKALATASSSYEEGIDFVAKIAKLLVASMGHDLIPVGRPRNTDNERMISEGTADILRFLSYVAPYFHPSNLGSWTFTLGAFLHYFCYELACRMGAAAGLRELRANHETVYDTMVSEQPAMSSEIIELPAHEWVALVDALLPLCQQALYSKNSHVSRAAEAAMLYLVQMDPRVTAPSFCDFGMRALDVTAVNSAHQAPAALSALTRLIQPTLRRAPEVFLRRLPTILQLTLAGIDSNDQNKTIRTLIFFRTLTSWLPIGGNVKRDATPLKTHNDRKQLEIQGIAILGENFAQNVDHFCKDAGYKATLSSLPESSLMHPDADDVEVDDSIMDQLSAATSDWVLEFLERVFELLRASGEREKAGKRSAGVASRHSSADVHQARNFSRVLKESLVQAFVAMDEETFRLASRSVEHFIIEESLPAAAKDASLLCQAVAGARGEDNNPGLDTLIPALTEDLTYKSNKTAIYRMRCLAGTVRSAGVAVTKHKEMITKALDHCFASDDRALFKTGCKVMRHLLATLTEPYPIPLDTRPRIYLSENNNLIFGKSAQLEDDPVQWHVPNRDCVEFAWEVLSKHVLTPLDDLSSSVDKVGEGKDRSRLLNDCNIQNLRRCLRLMRYSIRGGASVLVDEELPLGSELVPYEMASHRMLDAASPDVRQKLVDVRRRFCSFLLVLASIISSDTLHPDGISELSSDSPYSKTVPLISRDSKVCKETCDIALLLLTRRGASFRSQESMTVWKAQKQLSTDYTLSAQAEIVLEALEGAGLYTPHVLWKDGEDGGKCIPRRVLVTRVHLFHNSMIRSASFEVPKRMRRMNRDESQKRHVLFNAKSTLPEMLEYLEQVLLGVQPRPLDAYEGILDSLQALCCHSNTQVRASAIGVVEYALTRFGWLLRSRINRLLSAISLQDGRENGKYGIPSCANLTQRLNNQGKRKRLAESLKGVCSILALQRTTKFVLGSHKLRFQFMKTLCETDKLISLMPAEEMQKMIHYFHSIFSPFRSKLYNLPRTKKAEVAKHKGLLLLSIDFVSEKNRITTDDHAANAAEGGREAVHWRKMLTACWFLMVSIDSEDVVKDNEEIAKSWKTCFRLLQQEKGQPLQRVALGLLGKLSFLSEPEAVKIAVLPELELRSFARNFADALVYDHKEDSSFGGGHDAQWSAGVEEIIRESARFVARKSLFPFQRSNLGSGSFKVAHCQLLERLLTCLPRRSAQTTIDDLLNICKDLLSAPPNEDQKNQQVTAAEIFAGICRYYTTSDLMNEGLWKEKILPHFEDAVAKLPFGLTSAYSDALRFSLQFCDPSMFFPLTEFIVDKIQRSLWQCTNVANAKESSGSSSAHGTDGFNAQSKWLYLFSSLLVELDVSESDGVRGRTNFYIGVLTEEDTSNLEQPVADSYNKSWAVVTENLLPRLLDGLGHPFHSCRDHISRLLFRICNCHRKRSRTMASRSPSRPNSTDDLERLETLDDPGAIIVRKLSSLSHDTSLSFLDKYNALSTARRFLSYCLHLGESKFELSDFVTPALPMIFESLKSTVEEAISHSDGISTEDQAAWRALEAEVLKGFRYSVSEISMATTSPDRHGDVQRIMKYVESASQHEIWQVRAASAHFLRCFQGAHKFLLSPDEDDQIRKIVARLLSDDRREVCSSALAALTGVLTGLSSLEVSNMVNKYVAVANRSRMKRKKPIASNKTTEEDEEKEIKRARNQQTSVYFLCAAVMAQPYSTPSYVPVALTAISRHSFEKSAPLSVRDTVKKCCAEYKRTHMSDNWDEHRRAFSQEQMEALEDVVSSPHYYA